MPKLRNPRRVDNTFQYIAFLNRQTLPKHLALPNGVNVALLSLHFHYSNRRYWTIGDNPNDPQFRQEMRHIGALTPSHLN
jgi:hypothetical protein